MPKLVLGPPGRNWSNIEVVDGVEGVAQLPPVGPSVSSAWAVRPERGRISSGYLRWHLRWLTNAGRGVAAPHAWAHGHMYAMHSAVSPVTGDPDVARPIRCSARRRSRRIFLLRLRCHVEGMPTTGPPFRSTCVEVDECLASEVRLGNDGGRRVSLPIVAYPR